jgi:oligopeptide/dipeptide ABC transporter ATP-binding protein
LRAVNGVSFAIARRQTLGLVGESGCGKSTIGRTLLGLHAATSGRVTLAGRDLARMNRARPRDLRRMMQVVFQDPYGSLDPRMDVGEIVAEPLMINGIRDDARVRELMDRVGLPADAARRKPAAFSGGQRQRVAIARALALNPELIILDEAVSSLDVSIQAQVINLLKQLQREFGIAYLFISHNLAVVRHVSDQVAVMYLGRIVEIGPSDRVFGSPRHPYTKALLAAVPVPDPRRDRAPFMLAGDIPNPIRPASGCAFRTRCALAEPRCAQSAPELTARDHPEHFAACFVAASNTSDLGIAVRPQPALS